MNADAIYELRVQLMNQIGEQLGAWRREPVGMPPLWWLKLFDWYGKTFHELGREQRERAAANEAARGYNSVPYPVRAARWSAPPWFPRKHDP